MEDISERLGKLARFYDREAQRCTKGRAYFAAAVFESAALEAMLHAMCCLYPEAVRRTQVYQRRNFKPKKRFRSLEFSLYELIKIAKELSWFPPKRILWAGKRGDLALFVQGMREIRNHLHPAKWARQRSVPITYKKANFAFVEEIFEISHTWLLHHVHMSLAKDIKRKERKNSKICNTP